MDHPLDELVSPIDHVGLGSRSWNSLDITTLHSRESMTGSISGLAASESRQKQPFEYITSIDNGNQKPEGRLRRLWVSSKENIQALLRTFGLGILSAIRLRRPGSKRHREPTKVAIRQSRATSLLRTLIHAVPVGLSLWLVVLNWNGYYVGSFTFNLFYYQVGAKALEVMIQASLTTIIFSYIRHQMAIGNGLPFGALFSGLQISQISYLWSKEFWGSITSGSLPFRRKLAMLGMILVCFVLAAAAGPSGATLLVPRLDYWPAGTTHIWVNATAEEIWPTVLNASSVPDGCDILPPIMESTNCPGGEWEASLDWLIAFYNNIPPQLRPKVRYLAPPYSTQVTGKNSLRQLYMEFSQFYVTAGKTTTRDPVTFVLGLSVASTQQVAIADALVNTATLWSGALSNAKPSKGHGSAFQDDQDAVLDLVGYYQPYVKSFCAYDIIDGADDYRPVSFPIPDDYSDLNFTLLESDLTAVPAVEYPPLRKHQILELPGSPLEFRFKWLELPASATDSKKTSLGFVALQPQREALHLPRNAKSSIIVCRTDAGWGKSSMNTSTSTGTVAAVSSFPNPDDTLVSHISHKQYTNHEKVDKTNPEVSYYQEIDSSNTLWDIDQYPQIPIRMTPEWAESLNPVIPTLNDTVLNFLFSIVEKATLLEQNVALSVQSILSLQIANALGRIGLGYQFEGNPKLIQLDEINPLTGSKYTDIDGTAWIYAKDEFFYLDPQDEDKDWAKFRIKSTIEGYAYNTDGFAPKVAISFLLTYCVIALIHVFYSGITGISSSAWDSIAEVTALAMNSTPTVALRNTCAGITEMSIFRTPVRILAFMDSEGEGEHLEMVFGGRGDEEDESRTIKLNRTYGTLPGILRGQYRREKQR